MINRDEYLASCRQRAEALTKQMTKKELAGQMLHNAPAIPRLGIPRYSWWNEALHGAARGGVATVFPQAIALAALFDPQLLKKVAVVASTEQRARYNYTSGLGNRDIYKGVTVWSPNINIFRDPRWGRGQETYGEDPYLTTTLGLAFIDGLQGDELMPRVAACAKHFAAHSGPEADRHHFNSAVSKKDMEETYLPAFRAAIEKGGVLQLMSAYTAINGTPAALSPLLKDFVRNECGFKGIVVSDCWALRDIHEQYKVTKNAEESAAAAVKAGCDLNCGCTYAHLEKAIDKGLISIDEVRESVTRLFTLRYALGTLSDDGPYKDLGILDMDTAESRALNLEVAEKSIVLLENKAILPLKTEGTIAVIGPNADSRKVLYGNYHGTASRTTTVLEGIEELMEGKGRVLYAPGSALYRDKTEDLADKDDRITEAVAAAMASDKVVLVVGYDERIEGEQPDDGNGGIAGDRVNLGLLPPQQRLLEALDKTGKPIIVVITSGCGIDIGETKNVKAVIEAWYPGAEGGKAVANILFGKVSPSGKLPVTVYKKEAVLPDFNSYSMEGRTYRYADKEDILHPFGFGLTYMDNEILSAEVKDDEVLVKVRNHSQTEGDDVIELYQRPENSKRNPFLIGFKRYHLKADEEALIAVPFSREFLTVVNDDGIRKKPECPVSLFVGTDSKNLKIKLTIQP